MDVHEEIVRLKRAGIKAALATIVNVRGSIPSYESAKLLVREDGSIFGTVGGGCVEAEVWAAAREVIQEEKARTLSFNLNNDPAFDTGLLCGGTLEIFIEPILPTAYLYIFGAGHVSLALSKVATIAGFCTVIIDDRERFANNERFPEAVEIHAGEYEEVMDRLLPNSSSFIVIVTRGHHDDMRVLGWAVGTEARYIGMIGSRRKVIEIVKYLEKQGVSAAQLSRVHAPIGLEIGAIQPEEIAVSIVSELIAVRRKTVTGSAPKSKSILAVSKED
ncbi:MAG: xanthine dehydrogenase [Acidobacteria bacterium RIFCSPLOWO2_12_FULL_54_10]|nr:MAG: xanthine dehydrogenase [Acidobacteria bacterium RIFCSPLOWO2_12_FULL_54_10]